MNPQFSNAAGTVAAVLVAALLGACSLAPVVQRPDAPVAAAYPGAAAANEPGAAPAAALGWRVQLLPEWDDAQLAKLLGLDRA